ncbi:hypothetical protein YC2023_117476 [Brassica napus]
MGYPDKILKLGKSSYVGSIRLESQFMDLDQTKVKSDELLFKASKVLVFDWMPGDILPESERAGVKEGAELELCQIL